MSSRPLEIMVGIFVSLGVAAIFLLTFRVASLDSTGAGPSYTVTGRFSNIGGLKTGSAVTLAGVKIGRVSAINIDPSNFEAVVSLTLSAQYDQLPEDSSAKILTAGLLGEQYIGIEPGGLPDPLKDGSELMLTQGALVLENLIGQFVAGAGESSGDDALAEAVAKLADALKDHKPTQAP